MIREESNRSKRERKMKKREKGDRRSIIFATLSKSWRTIVPKIS